jgi:hypothetical protein
MGYIIDKKYKYTSMRSWVILSIKNTNIQVSVVTLEKRENISSKQHNSIMAHDTGLMPME